VSSKVLIPKLTARTLKINREDPTASSNTPLKEIIISGSKATVAVWAPLSDFIITGHENGKVAKYDAKTGEEVLSNTDSHSGIITDLQLSPDGTYFITASKDKTSRVSRL
jgi:translation initiation factor 3 subunit I